MNLTTAGSGALIGMMGLLIWLGVSSRSCESELTLGGSDEPTVKSSSARDEDGRFMTYEVRRGVLNTRLPHDLFIDASIWHDGKHFSVRIIVQRGREIDYAEQTYRRSQIVPDYYKWQIRNVQGKVSREWLAFFVKNRDLTHHTLVRLPMEDLRRSYLLLYFEDVDGDGAREDVTYEIDMTEYDWEEAVRSLGKVNQATLTN